MKVILIEDVKSLGKKGQLVEVNDGYARNFILAKKLGLEATPKNLNDLKLKKANDEKVAKEIYEEAKALDVYKRQVLDSPTRGIDIKVKQDIYQLMNQMRKNGKSIIMILSLIHISQETVQSTREL